MRDELGAALFVLAWNAGALVLFAWWAWRTRSVRVRAVAGPWLVLAFGLPMASIATGLALDSEPEGESQPLVGLFILSCVSAFVTAIGVALTSLYRRADR